MHSDFRLSLGLRAIIKRDLPFSSLPAFGCEQRRSVRTYELGCGGYDHRRSEFAAQEFHQAWVEGRAA